MSTWVLVAIMSWNGYIVNAPAIEFNSEASCLVVKARMEAQKNFTHKPIVMCTEK